MDADQIASELRAFLRDVLGVSQELSADTDLVTTGLIDSADLVRVATWLERQLGIEVPDADIDVDHFDSIERIVAYARARLG